MKGDECIEVLERWKLGPDGAVVRYERTVLNANDVNNFYVGDRIVARMRPDGSLRSETWRDRWADALASVFWPRPTTQVTAVDAESGTITVGVDWGYR